MQMGYYIPILVICSYLIALFTAYNVVSVNRLLDDKSSLYRNGWILVKAIVMSVGIGAMQYVGLMGYLNHTNFSYTPFFAWFALGLLFLGCYLAFLLMSRKKTTKNDLFIAGLLLTGGLLGVHYMGMRAIVSNGISYHPLFLMGSVLLSFISGMYTIWIVITQNKLLTGQLRIIQDAKKAIVLALLLSAVFYFGLVELQFETDYFLQPEMGLEATYLVVTISLFTILLQLSFLGVSAVSFAFDTNRREISKLKDMSYSLLKSNPDPVLLINAAGEILSLNDAAQLLFSTELEQGITRIEEVMEPQQYCRSVSYFTEAINERKNVQFETKVTTNDGTVKEFKIQIVPIIIEELKITEIFLVGADITKENQVEKMIRSLAYHDGLTKLPNRYFMKEYIEDCLNELRQRYAFQKKTILSIYYIDMTELKKINDRYGHNIGDLYLTKVAQRIQRYIGKEYFLARVGGDEFVLTFIEEYAGETEDVGENLLKVFGKAMVIEKIRLFPAASIGLVKAYEDGSEFEELLTKVDIAMYSAKQQVRETGKTLIISYSQYEKQLQNEYQKELELMKGIEKKEFLLHYQPKVHADTEELYGVEALIRWQVPWEDDLRYPDQFIPLAEQTGHIIQLSEQIIEMACHQIKVWLNLGFTIPVSLNLSANDFHGDALVCLVAKQLAKHQIPPNLLELEITETVLMADLAESQKNLKQLHKMGVQLSIDDFGTGYSSLRYVIDFPIQSLKIDRSFTEALNLDAKVTAVTETIIQLADKLHLQVIVEGVETKEQLATLKTMGNFIIQGYYFSKPVSAKDVTDKWLKG
ncbi:EAL domain-containing protein [Carnobacterium maltaromaticum]|jgi:diguanylate cyclase (GGDEF)-like protein/PAS domain S-box-containing protein|uniref:bifunctional diguanylate cyclase/phosphodiesterase n=1 Tax=Carnobacterium TaxID=2747 RepID=UPI0005536261|nr:MULTISPECIES: EAL domain-containing protein [Carnobacterium]AOA03169.1 sensor protein [Carnobacterium maltaromaticum]KRN69045.1 hypothetical protein IV70_GL000656 [Carnobacterium maltaromaticum DSM 20342]MBQ6484013.1 EAL domain-containing protein [Carnobacterium sp.]MCC4312834.1 sensor protein [Carnobacterium maltaromaticum]MCI1817601.1 EAL domain-containing protein [Carnobacterium maltaromaticum]